MHMTYAYATYIWLEHMPHEYGVSICQMHMQYAFEVMFSNIEKPYFIVSSKETQNILLIYLVGEKSIVDELELNVKVE